jgi:hypothetical protein
MKWLLGAAMASNVCVALGTPVPRMECSRGARCGTQYGTVLLVVVMVAFAAPGLTRLVRGVPVGARLVQAFVAAHLVHFGVIGALIASSETAHLVQKPIAFAVILVFGFSLVVGAGLTATPRGSRFYSGLHKFTLYALFLIFFSGLCAECYETAAVDGGSSGPGAHTSPGQWLDVLHSPGQDPKLTPQIVATRFVPHKSSD